MNTILLDGYLIVKLEDLQALGQANQSKIPLVVDPARPEVPGRCGADPPEPLLTVRQAAQHLGVSPSSIHNYISSHELPAIRLGRTVRIQPTDLADFIAAHKQNGNGRV